MNEKLDTIIVKWSVLAGVADITPVLGADIAAVVACQLKMFYDMAEQFEVTVTREQLHHLHGAWAGIESYFPLIRQGRTGA